MKQVLAPYACYSDQSRGRLHDEPGSPGRSVYQRDRDRIIHSTAFRRLEYKTQVFVYHEGDHYRTRLTHSLEVAQLARDTARELGLDEDLTEAIALAHDLGHPPFGHAGEDALKAMMEPYGGFDHNAQAIRILTKLEAKYAAFDGLNLTWEALEGVAKHNGPVSEPIPRALKEYNEQHDLQLDSYANLEAQVAAICDDIAYNSHDIEDGMRAGLITEADLESLPLVGDIVREVRKAYPKIAQGRLMHETRRRMIHAMVSDMVAETRKAIEDNAIETVEDVRNAGKTLVAFSEQMEADHRVIKAFLFENLYRHYKVNRMTSKASKVVSDLFGFFLDDPSCLPTEWREQVEAESDQTKRAIIITDFIAGMTDRFALEEHTRVFDVSYKLIGN